MQFLSGPNSGESVSSSADILGVESSLTPESNGPASAKPSERSHSVPLASTQEKSKRTDNTDRAQDTSQRMPMSEEEMAELDAKTNTVEEQMHHLTSCLQRLSEELVTEQTTNQLLSSQVTDAVHKLAEAKDNDLNRDAVLKQKQQLNHESWEDWQAHNTLKANPLMVEQLLKENKELLMLLEEERLSKIELRAQYENQLNFLRHIVEKSKMDERRKVLRELDYVIRKYHGLAEEAARLARRERNRTKEEKLRIQRVAETACKGFEKDLKEKTKLALDEYRKLAHEAHKAANREREELTRYCHDIESAVDKERRTFEAHVVRETEKRVAAYRRSCAIVQQQMERDRTKFQDIVNEMCNTIEDKCQQFESSMHSKMLQVLWENGVDMTEDAFILQLQKAKGVPLRSAIAERAQMEAEAQMLSLHSLRTNPCKYGIYPISFDTEPQSETEPRVPSSVPDKAHVAIKEAKTVRFEPLRSSEPQKQPTTSH